MNKLLGANFAAMARKGDPVLKPFLQVPPGFAGLSLRMGVVAVGPSARISRNMLFAPKQRALLLRILLVIALRVIYSFCSCCVAVL